jgi:TP901 family phage tail tape measure protein
MAPFLLLRGGEVLLEKAFELAVVFSAVDHMTGPISNMARQLGVLDEKTKQTQARLNEFKNMAFVGGAITLAGGFMAKGLLSAVDAAGNLQTSLMGVKESLGLTNNEYQKLMNLSQTVGLPTIFSAEDVGGIMQAMATSGLSKQQVLNPDTLKQYVNFADVQSQIKHENAPDVVSSAVQMAHQYQLYSPEQIQPFLNNLNAALLHTHDSASEFATTYKYISNQARSMGMGATDTLDTTAWLSRMGFGSGRGGTNFADFLQRSIYHSSGKKADKAMTEAGFVKDGHSVFEDAKGNFVGIPQSVKIMQDFAKRFGNNANTMNPLLKDIFGTQGARVAMMMTSSGASEQYTNVQKQINGTSSIDKTQSDLNKTWSGQYRQFVSTLGDIQQAFGKALLPALLPLAEGLNNILGKILKFEQAHPGIMKIVAAFASLLTAILLIVGPILTVIGVFGFIKEGGFIKSGLELVGRSFTTLGGGIVKFVSGAIGNVGKFFSFMVANPVVAIILAIIAIVALLYEAWIHDWGGIREKTHEVIEFCKQKIESIKETFENVKAKVSEFVTDIGKYWDDLKNFFANPIQGTINLVKNISGNSGGGSVGNYIDAKVGQNANGTDYWRGGLTWVGEKGPEIVNLPRGSQVIPNHKLGQALQGDSQSSQNSQGDVHFHGDIVINTQPGQSAEEIAQMVMKKIGRTMRKQSNSRSTLATQMW